MTSGSPATHVRGDPRLIEDSTTGVPCGATSHLPDGHQGVAFFQGNLSPLLFDPTARELVLRTSLLVDVAIPPLASHRCSTYQQKCQRQEAQ